MLRVQVRSLQRETGEQTEPEWLTRSFCRPNAVKEEEEEGEEPELTLQFSGRPAQHEQSLELIPSMGWGGGGRY